MHPVLKFKKQKLKPHAANDAVLPQRAVFVPNYVKSGAHCVVYLNGFVWVANRDDGSVAKINTTTFEITSYSVGGGPLGICTDGTSIYVTCIFTGQLIKINAATGAIVWSVATGTNALICVYDNSHIFVTNYGGATVCKVTTAGSVVASVNIGNYPCWFCSDGTFLWVAKNGTGLIYKLDFSLNIVASYSIGTSMISTAFDGTDIWATDSNNVYRVNKTTGTVLNTYSLGGGNGFDAIVYLPFYDVLAVACTSINAIKFIKKTDGSVLETVAVGDSPRNVITDLAGNCWVASVNDGKVCRIIV